MKTQLILVAAPSGAGKSSFVDRVIAEIPQLEDVITYTTRPMRHHEVPGQPYYFISPEDFQKRIENGFFVEWAKVHTNFYGTSHESLVEAWNREKVVIMDIDVQGVRTFRQKFPQVVQTIFILPPSLEELRRRVIKRDRGATADLDVRMKNAALEMAEASQFDFQIVNDDFEQSYNMFKKIIEDLLRLK